MQSAGTLEESDIKLVKGADGTSLGEAFVHFHRPDSKVRLALALDKSMMPVSPGPVPHPNRAALLLHAPHAAFFLCSCTVPFIQTLALLPMTYLPVHFPFFLLFSLTTSKWRCSLHIRTTCIAACYLAASSTKLRLHLHTKRCAS
jgi:hypothetical protein